MSLVCVIDWDTSTTLKFIGDLVRAVPKLSCDAIRLYAFYGTPVEVCVIGDMPNFLSFLRK